MTKHIVNQTTQNYTFKTKRMLGSYIFGAAIMFITMPATAAQFKGENNTYESSDFTKETFALIQSAEEGLAHNQTVLGSKYRNGDGVPQSNDLAMHWYLKAAAQGDVDAHADIGSLYYLGLGIQKSEETAARWYEKAASRGHEKAARNAAILFSRGELPPSLKQRLQNG